MTDTPRFAGSMENRPRPGTAGAPPKPPSDTAEAALGRAYALAAGHGMKRDLEAARAEFARAADKGCAAAVLPLVSLLANGAGGQPRQWNEALARFAAHARGDAMLGEQVALLQAMAIDGDGDCTKDWQPRFHSHDPLVVGFPAFMTPRECDGLIASARPHLRPAQVVDPVRKTLIRDPVRDSSTAAFSLLEETPFIHALNRRIAKASRSLPEQGEPMQVLAYEPGQQYRMHLDTLPQADNQRIQTFLVYLSDDFEGGETVFPDASLAVKPRKGDAICFSNVSADMRPLATARHAGRPVIGGIKYVLSRWIRQRPLDLTGYPSP